MLVRALIAVEDLGVRKRVRAAVKALGGVSRSKRKNEALWERLQTETVDFVVVDHAVLPEPYGESIAAIRDLPGEPDVVVMTLVKDPEERALLVVAGCVGVLAPDLPDDALQETLGAFFERRQETTQLRLDASSEENRLGDFVSTSPSMHRLIGIARRVASSDTTVLILGETGVGKESLARALHVEGPRSDGAFIAVNCGAIPETLFESELFGHQQGAFTGATRDHRGHFEMAHGGTIFLDEVAELPMHLQVKLLRALQEHLIQRVGAETPFAVDVRVIAATNRDPLDEIREGRLREDLYYRLGVVRLELPPLRERREDVADLAQNYFDIFCAKIGRKLSGVDADVMDALVAYRWPGNVRELINVMERAVLLASSDTVTLADLPDEIAGGPTVALEQLVDEGKTESSEPLAPVFSKPYREARREVLDAFDKQYFTALLAETRGRILDTADLAGVSSRALYSKMKELGLRKETFRYRGNRAHRQR